LTRARIFLYHFPPELSSSWRERIRPFPVEVGVGNDLEKADRFDIGFHFIAGEGIPPPPSTSPWIAVTSEISLEIIEKFQGLGYLTALPADAPGWAIVEPLLRVQHKDRMVEELHRLLQEGVEYHQIFSLLEEIRNLIPRLSSPRRFEDVLQLYLKVTHGDAGALWWREGVKENTEERFLLKAETHPSPPPLIPRTFSWHEILPLLQEDALKHSYWIDNPPYTLLIPLGKKEEPEGILYIHRKERFSHPYLLAERVKILNNWVTPLLSFASWKGSPSAPDLQGKEEFFENLQQLLKLARRYERYLTTVFVWIPRETWERYDLIGAISAILRDSDLLGKYDGEKIAIALPETSYMGGEYFLRRLHRELRRRYPLSALRITTTLATTPYHGLLLEDLLRYHEEEYHSLELLSQLTYPATPPARWLSLLRETGKGISLEDPNQWGDLLCTALAELNLIHPKESRLCLYITDPERFQKWFSSLHQAVIAWDRVLITADRPFPHSAWGAVYGVDAGFKAPAYMILLDSPWGGICALAEVREGGWYGGLFWEKGWARHLFDLWENRFMIHKRWLTV
jgi:hypothetical protein